jgi:hypothetical protein
MACWVRELGFHDDELVSQKSEAVKAGEGCGANNEDVANDPKLESVVESTTAIEL